MPQICDMGPTALLPSRRKACVGFFSPEKIRRLRPSLNPRSWVPEGSTLTTRPPTLLRTTLGDNRKQSLFPEDCCTVDRDLIWCDLQKSLSEFTNTAAHTNITIRHSDITI